VAYSVCESITDLGNISFVTNLFYGRHISYSILLLTKLIEY